MQAGLQKVLATKLLQQNKQMTFKMLLYDYDRLYRFFGVIDDQKDNEFLNTGCNLNLNCLV